MNNLEILEQKYKELGEEIARFKNPFEYPILKRNPKNGDIIKFISLKMGIIVMTKDDDLGHTCEFTEHPHPYWEDVPYSRELDLYQGQPVYCWDDRDTHSKTLRFYDAVSKCAFTYYGKADGGEFSSYEAVEIANYTKWMIEAFYTLKDIDDE